MPKKFIFMRKTSTRNRKTEIGRHMKNVEKKLQIVHTAVELCSSKESGWKWWGTGKLGKMVGSVRSESITLRLIHW